MYIVLLCFRDIMLPRWIEVESNFRFQCTDSRFGGKFSDTWGDNTAIAIFSFHIRNHGVEGWTFRIRLLRTASCCLRHFSIRFWWASTCLAKKKRGIWKRNKSIFIEGKLMIKFDGNKKGKKMIMKKKINQFTCHCCIINKYLNVYI